MEGARKWGAERNFHKRFAVEVPGLGAGVMCASAHGPGHGPQPRRVLLAAFLEARKQIWTPFQKRPK